MAKDLSSGILKINVNRVVGEELTSLTKFLSDKQVSNLYISIFQHSIHSK